MRGHVEIVRLLLEKGADRSIRNKQDKVQSRLQPEFKHAANNVYHKDNFD